MEMVGPPKKPSKIYQLKAKRVRTLPSSAFHVWCVSISLNPLETPFETPAFVSVGMWPSATLSRYYAMVVAMEQRIPASIIHCYYMGCRAAFSYSCNKWLFSVCAAKLKREKRFDDSIRIHKTTAVTRVECNHFIVYLFFRFDCFGFFCVQIDKEIKSNSFSEFLYCFVPCREWVPKFVYIPTFIAAWVFSSSKFHRLIQRRKKCPDTSQPIRWVQKLQIKNGIILA